MNLSFRYLVLEVFAVGRRIILDSVRSAGNFCLLQKPDLFDLAIGTAVDFVAGFLGSLCSIFPRIFCCQSGESYENVGNDDDNIVNIFSDE